MVEIIDMPHDSDDETFAMKSWDFTRAEHGYVTRKWLEGVKKEHKAQLARGLKSLLKRQALIEREVGRILWIDEGELNDQTKDEPEMDLKDNPKEYYSTLTLRENQIIEAAGEVDQKGVIFEADLIAKLREVIEFDKPKGDTKDSTLKKDIDALIKKGILKVTAK